MAEKEKKNCKLYNNSKIRHNVNTQQTPGAEQQTHGVKRSIMLHLSILIFIQQ